MITIYHNTNRHAMIDGFQPADVLDKVFEIDRVADVHRIEKALGAIYELLNVGDDPEFGTPDPTAVDYRKNELRSLSVGDVVDLGRGGVWAVERFGWRELSRDAVTS